jgi:fructose-bisphosphate aldolase class II
MMDASDKEFSENIAITSKVVSLCRPLNISVEAELGHVAGNEGMYTHDEGVYTEPEQALEFVEKTGIDALAVSVGTVHGVYKSTPILSFERCEAIKKAVNGLPLVLHGGSGLSDEDFRHIIACGINKVNIFTDLTLEAMESLRNNDLSGKKAYFSVSSDVVRTIKFASIKKLERFGCIGKA